MTRALLLILALAGCGDGAPADAARIASAPNGATVVTAGSGAITGRVIYTGAPRAAATLAVTGCHAGVSSVPDETALVAPDGALANVFVYLKGARLAPGAAVPPRPAVVIDQQACVFAPHVAGALVGQAVELKNSDPVFHNVRWTSERNGSENLGFTAGQTRAVTFAEAEFVNLRCDVHPWMGCWLGVFDGPFFTTTTANGAFELAGLSDGTYTLATWHELYGETERQIEVRGGRADVRVEVGPSGG